LKAISSHSLYIEGSLEFLLFSGRNPFDEISYVDFKIFLSNKSILDVMGMWLKGYSAMQIALHKDGIFSSLPLENLIQ